MSIDDFGAGFTSLAYLSSLAVGELKLDSTFITALGTEGKERDLELVRATIKLGHDMRLRVVAEGNGYWDATMTYAAEDWLARQILGFGADVQVLAPQSLAERVRASAVEALNGYATLDS